MLKDLDTCFCTAWFLNQSQVKSMGRVVIALWNQNPECIANWSDASASFETRCYMKKITIMLQGVHSPQGRMMDKHEKHDEAEEARLKGQILRLGEKSYFAQTLKNLQEKAWENLSADVKLRCENPRTDGTVESYPIVVNYTTGCVPFHMLADTDGAIVATCYVHGDSLVVFGGPLHGDSDMKHRHVPEGHMYAYHGDLRHVYEQGAYATNMELKAKPQNITELMGAMTIHDTTMPPLGVIVSITFRFGKSKAVDLERGATAETLMRDILPRVLVLDEEDSVLPDPDDELYTTGCAVLPKGWHAVDPTEITADAAGCNNLRTLINNPNNPNSPH